MRNKYVMVSGFAFSEETDMEKLSSYAREGWILESIKGMFFYKLKKDTPQDIIYSLDYQKEATEEYFHLFSEAGWKKVISIGNEIHIFSAPAGTKPIYSERNTEIEKYVDVKNKAAKGSVYSLALTIASMALMALSIAFIRPIFLLTVLLFLVSIIAFVFNFMPYLAYSSRLKGKDNIKSQNNMKLISGMCFALIGAMSIFSKNYISSVLFFSISAIEFSFLSRSYKKKS